MNVVSVAKYRVMGQLKRKVSLSSRNRRFVAAAVVGNAPRQLVGLVDVLIPSLRHFQFVIGKEEVVFIDCLWDLDVYTRGTAFGERLLSSGARAGSFILLRHTASPPLASVSLFA